MSSPLVSVLITAYQPDKESIEEAIASVRAQEYANLEVLVVDDGSSPRVDELVDKDFFKDVRYEYMPHKGLPYGLIRGVELAKGDYVAVLDQDDRLHDAQSLGVRVAALQRSKGSFAYGNMVIVNQAGVEFAHRKFKAYATGDGFVEAFMKNFFGPAQHSTVLFDRRLALEVGGYDASYQAGFDNDLLMRLASRRPATYVDHTVLDYRAHPKNTSATIKHRLDGLRQQFHSIERHVSSPFVQRAYKTRAAVFTGLKIAYLLGERVYSREQATKSIGRILPDGIISSAGMLERNPQHL